MSETKKKESKFSDIFMSTAKAASIATSLVALTHIWELDIQRYYFQEKAVIRSFELDAVGFSMLHIFPRLPHKYRKMWKPALKGKQIWDWKAPVQLMRWAKTTEGRRFINNCKRENKKVMDSFHETIKFDLFLLVK